MTPEKYDLGVIGSGPAGEKGAAQAAYFGKRVALVEREPVLGGASANTGTLPSKTLRESALVLSGLRARRIYGVHTTTHDHDVSVGDFMMHKEFVVARERDRIDRNLKRHDVELVPGHATFITPNTVRVTADGVAPRELTADVFLIATGSSPYRPPEIPFGDPEVDDSDEVLHLPVIPKSLIVLGGG